MADQPIYQTDKVTVTTTKVVFGNTTHFLRNIASIRPVSTTNLVPVVMCGIGGLLALIGLFNLKSAWFVLLLGAGMIYGAFKMGFKIHQLVFETSAGSVKGFQGKEAEVYAVKAKIEEALAAMAHA